MYLRDNYSEGKPSIGNSEMSSLSKIISELGEPVRDMERHVEKGTQQITEPACARILRTKRHGVFD